MQRYRLWFLGVIVVTAAALLFLTLPRSVRIGIFAVQLCGFILAVVTWRRVP